MATQKYVALSAGALTEVVPAVVGGVGKDGQIPALDGAGKFDATMMPVGIAPEIVTCNASEGLLAGDIINLWNDGGTLKARKASAADGYKADGFVLAAVDLGDPATVYLEGNITGLTGKTIGAKQWVGDTPGTLVEAGALPTDTGHIIQPVGKAISATEVTFEPKDAVTLA